MRGAAWFVLFWSCSAKPGPADAPSDRPATNAGPSRVSAPPRPAASSSATPDDRRPVAEPEETAEESAFVVGPAHIRLGERPPWQAPLQHRAAPSPATATAWRLARTLWVGVGYLHQVELSADGGDVYVLSEEDGVLRHFDTKTGRRIATVPIPDFEPFDDAGFALVESTGLYVGTREAAYWLDLETDTLEAAPELPVYPEVQASNVSGLFGLSVRHTDPQSGAVSLVWLDSGRSPEEALRAECTERPDDWALSPDGKQLALSYYPSNRTQIIDLVERRLLADMEAPRWGGTLAISPDGTLLSQGGAELWLHRFPSGERLDTDAGYGNNISNIRFSPSGDRLLVAAYDGRVRSYALGAGAAELPSPRILRHTGTANVYGISLSRDGRKLATSSGDQTVKIWIR